MYLLLVCLFPFFVKTFLYYICDTLEIIHFSAKRVFQLKLISIISPGQHTLQPLCDLFATDNFHQSQRSQQGPRSVPARLQRSRRLVGDLAKTKSVAARFLNMLKRLAATDLVADRSRQSRRPVPDQSPTSRRPIAD